MFVFLTSIPKLSYAFDMTCVFHGLGYMIEVSQIMYAYEGFKDIVSNEKEEKNVTADLRSQKKKRNCNVFFSIFFKLQSDQDGYAFLAS